MKQRGLFRDPLNFRMAFSLKIVGGAARQCAGVADVSRALNLSETDTVAVLNGCEENASRLQVEMALAKPHVVDS